MDTLKQTALLYLRLKVFHFCKIFRQKCPCFNGPFRYAVLIPLPSYSARATFCLADLARKLIFTVYHQETEIFEWGVVWQPEVLVIELTRFSVLERMSRCLLSWVGGTF